MITPPSFADVSNQDLLTTVKRLAQKERETTVELIAALIELDTRRLYLAEGCSSLFTYCTKVLHLSDHAAYGRIEAARAARRLPLILELLAEGSVTLTTVTLLAPHLTHDNHRTVLEAARHRSKREVELQVANLRARPDVPSSIRKQPTRKISTDTIVPPATVPPITSDPLVASTTSAYSVLLLAAPSGPLRTKVPGDSGTTGICMSYGTPLAQPHARCSVIEPLTLERYKLQVTVGAETIEKLRRAQDLMRHIVPNGDPPVSSTVHSRCCWNTWSDASLPRPTVHAPGERPGCDRGTFRQRSAVPSGHVTRAVAPTSAPREGVPSVVSWSFIISIPIPWAGSRPWRTSACAVDPTMHTKPSRSSVCVQRRTRDAQ
jgi:hypothetical protein